MKRSEIIDTISNLLSEHYTPTTNYSLMANNMLDVLEQLGMAPPEVTEPVKTSVMVATPLGYQEMVVEDSNVFVRKWEDEA